MHSCLLRIPTLTCMEGSLIERTSLRLYLAVSAPSTRVSNVREVKKCIAPGSKRTTRMQNVSFRSETPSVYLGRHWHHTCEKMDQAFPLCFYILQAIKNWTVGRPRDWERGYSKCTCLLRIPCILNQRSSVRGTLRLWVWRLPIQPLLIAVSAPAVT